MAKRGRKKGPHSWSKNIQLQFAVHTAKPARKSVRMRRLSKDGPFAGQSTKYLRKKLYRTENIAEAKKVAEVIVNLKEIPGGPEALELLKREARRVLRYKPRPRGRN
jgi:hypothetical protein